VADLVIQPRVLGGAGGGLGGGGVFGGGGGGFGGGGLGGGGFGGGGGGFGGGGGGFGGGGGGFFSLPDPEQPAAKAQPKVFDAGAIDQLKKKPARAK
jgi:hypothetical protein